MLSAPQPPDIQTILGRLINQLAEDGVFILIVLDDYQQNIATLLECESSAYWLTHYRFDKLSPKRKKTLGSDSINNILINTIAPFIFVYGKQKSEETYVDRALGLLEKTLPEKNSIISKWQELGVNAKNACEAQARLQLKNEYCAKKKCLECSVGAKLLSPSLPLSKGKGA